MVRHRPVEYRVFGWEVIKWWWGRHRHVNGSNIGLLVGKLVHGRVIIHRGGMKAALLRGMLRIRMRNTGGGTWDPRGLGRWKCGQAGAHKCSSRRRAGMEAQVRRGMWRRPFAHGTRCLLILLTHWRARCRAHIWMRSMVWSWRGHSV